MMIVLELERKQTKKDNENHGSSIKVQISIVGTSSTIYIILTTNHLLPTVTSETEVTRLKTNRAKVRLGPTDGQEQDKRKVKGK